MSLPDPSDPRLIKDGIEDYSDLPEPWIDYVADMGDGWNSTYSVAYHLSQPTLSCRDPKEVSIRRSRSGISVRRR